MGSKSGTRAMCFFLEHMGEHAFEIRSSNSQMLFLADMLSKMKHDTPLSSRIAEVHNSNSLFTCALGRASTISAAGLSTTTSWRLSLPCT